MITGLSSSIAPGMSQVQLENWTIACTMVKATTARVKKPKKKLAKTFKAPAPSDVRTPDAKVETSCFCVVLKSLPLSTTIADIKALLADIGTPQHIHLKKDGSGKKVTKLRATLEFDTEDAGKRALAHLQGAEVRGHLIEVGKSVVPTSSSRPAPAGDAEASAEEASFAKSLKELDAKRCIQLHFYPAIRHLTPAGALALVNHLLPSTVRVRSFYRDSTAGGGPWIFMFGTVQEAASVAELLNNRNVPLETIHAVVHPDEVTLDNATADHAVIESSCWDASVVKALQATLGEDKGRTSARLTIRHISPSVSERQLFHILKKYGLIRKMKLVAPAKGAIVRTSHAFVYFKAPEAAEKAREELNGKLLCGKCLAVDWGIDRSLRSELAQGLIPLSEPDLASIVPPNA